MHARGDFFGEQFEQEFGHYSTSTPWLFNHAAAEPLASSRTRRIYAWRSVTLIAPLLPTPAELGVSPEIAYDDVVSLVNANMNVRPEACAKAQAYWDQYLESLAEGAFACVSAADAKAMLEEALVACRGIASDMTVYFGFDKADITAAAQAVIDEVVTMLASYSAPLVSIVGHTDTVGSFAYNQQLSERRAAAHVGRVAPLVNLT